MLTDWITRQGDEEERPDAEVALAELWEIVSNASEGDIPGLVAELTADRFGALVETPLHNQDATELLARIIDRLGPDPEQSEVLERRFPLSWSMSVMGGEGFEPRPLLNGALLVRNMHRVLGPAMWDGVILDMSPDLTETLHADLETLRGRNADGDSFCFLLKHDERGARLLGSEETVDVAAPGWGQLIAVCALQQEDLVEGSPLLTRELRRIGRKARSMVVFLRFFGDRVDLIPASRYDDDLDVFLEELAFYELGSNLEEGMELPAPLAGEPLEMAVIERIGYETGHIPEEGAGGVWFHTFAVPALAKRLSSTMTWSTVNFGLGPDPAGPRRAVPLPNGVEAAITDDPALKRRSVTLQVMASQEATRDLITEGLLLERISEAFEEVGVEGVALDVSGRVDHDLDADEAVLALVPSEELPDAFSDVIGRIAERAEEDGEELDDAVVNASLGVILLIDFPDERPSDLLIAAMAKTLSGVTEDTVRLFLNGRGEYLAYAEGDVDSGDHELFRLDAQDGSDAGDEDEEEGLTLSVDVYTKDVDAALAAFKAALEAGATSVRISSNEEWGTKAFENVNLMFEATPGSDVIALVKRPPFVRDPGDLREGADAAEGEDLPDEDVTDDWSGDDPDEEAVDEEEGEDQDHWGGDDPDETDAHEEGDDASLDDEQPAVQSSISLIKGQNLSLSRTDPALQRVIIGLGWDPRATDGQEFDLDASVFLLGENGKVRSDEDFIFYNQRVSGCGSVEHTGDNRTGDGDGDDEQIRVDLSRVPSEVRRLAVTVTIHEAETRGQSFGQVSNAFIRVVNEESGAELVRYDLSEEYSTETAMIFGELYRRNDEWKFRAVGQGYGGGLAAMCAQFGITL